MKYHYKCDSCGRTTELDLRISEDKPISIDCLCGKTQRRLFEAPQIAYKGQGFYSTDQNLNMIHKRMEDADKARRE